RRSHPDRLVAVVGIGGQTVDIGDGDAGVVSRFHNRLAGEPKLALRCAAALVVLGLAQADDCRLVFNRQSVRCHSICLTQAITRSAIEAQPRGGWSPPAAPLTGV